jgi:hypothetical protein
MFKVYVDTGESTVSTNALEFDTVESAETYARDLASRWLLVRRWFVYQVPESDIRMMRVLVEDMENDAVLSGDA